eukprot:scaffold12250_cov150-Skeletonema_dohrnii-CCMP3373.AAC.3
MFCTAETKAVPGAVHGGRAVPDRSYFDSDELHLNNEGYNVWRAIWGQQYHDTTDLTAIEKTRWLNVALATSPHRISSGLLQGSRIFIAADATMLSETQLDYFLYNKMTRNPRAMDAQVKVERALQLLARHFEIVAMGGHDKFKQRIQQFTGWEEKEMPRKNSHKGTLNFTKKEVENMQKLLEENGDIDFIEKVKLLFDNPTI